MSSPHLKPPPTTPPSKDSPTTNIFNNLSPIKLISTRFNSQAFDIDVPSPQPVFATPQNCIMNSKQWKRSHTLAFRGPQKIFQDDVDHDAASLEYTDITRQYFPMSAAQSNNCSNKYRMDGEKNNISNHHPHDQFYRSPSNGVDEFLSIPFEVCGNISGSSGIFLGEADDLICDKEINFVSSTGDQMPRPNEIFVQVPLIKSASTVTNCVTECTEHSKLVSMPNMQPNKVVLPEAFPNNSVVHEGSGKVFLVSNTRESSNLDDVGQNSSYQSEKNPAKQKTSNLTESTYFEEIGIEGGALEANINSLLPSVSSTNHESIAPDRKGPNHSCVPSNMDFNTVDHGDECPSTSTSYFLGRHDANLYSSTTGYSGQFDHVTEAKCEILNNAFNANHHGISSQMKDASVNIQIPYDQEDAVYHSRCMYKRLQFENIEEHESSIAYTANSMNLESSHFISETTTLPSNTESLHASNANTSTMSGRVQSLQSKAGISCNYLVKTDSSDQSQGISTAMVPRSSCIGLHLNSIGVPGQMNSHIEMEMPMEGLSTGGKTFSHTSCQAQSQVLKNMMVSRNVARQASVQIISKSAHSSLGSNGECNNERLPKQEISFPDCHSPIEVKPLNMSEFDFNDHNITPCSGKRLPSEEASKSEDSTKTSHGKKRRKASEIDGQKSCNCKRSKCLKLYCDCFAAGLFCNADCACQGCFNKSEHEEMVSSTRQLIETRNPLAFAPKVVHANGDKKDNGDNKHITPPSARHKRGCNCKRSKCLKKYCECYQAGVGCSLGCRCEGCKNAHGTKEAYGDITEIVVEHQKPKDDALSREPSGRSLEVMDAKTEVLNAKQINRRFISSAPLVQGMNVKGGSRLQLCANSHRSSESNFATLTSSESPTSTMNLKISSPQAEKCEEPLSIIPYRQFDSNSALNIDSLSPRWNGFTGISNVNPSSGPSSSLCRSSTSRTAQVMINNTKLFPDRDALSGVSPHQQCSPLLTQGRCSINPVAVESHYNLADETPEMLKDDHFPVRTVKVSSPNQKRVSPPKKMLRDAGSSFSPGLKSGRKYVLLSIPQFPPLTPCSSKSLEDTSTGGSLEEQGGK